MTTASPIRRARTPMLLAAAVVILVTVAFAALTVGAAGGEEHGHGVDAADGFGAAILAPHTSFPDDVAAQLRFRYTEPGNDRRTHVANLPDAGPVLVAEVNWEPGGTSGWHTHPGPVIVAIVAGDVEVTNADDCIPRTYTAGEAFIDPGQGNVHIATNASSGEPAKAYAVFFAVPDGEPATEHVAPGAC
jgi:quercetin dioxygenase-like cupin family protein